MTRPAAAAGTALDPPASPGPSWSGVEHRHLAALAALARARSFRGAARELGCSQSTLSQHIAQLERAAGRRLAERRRGSSQVRLTPEGERLIGHVGPILAAFGAARADVRAVGATSGEQLRIGLAEHLAAGVAARVLPELRRREPELEISLSCRAPAWAHLEALRAGALDVVVGDLPPEPAPLAFRRLAPEPYVLLAPTAWPGARSGRPSVAAMLEHLPVAVNGADPDAARVVAELGLAGVTVSLACELTSYAAILVAVLGGHAAALVPRSAAGGDPRVAVYGVDGLVAPRPTGVLWHGGRRRTARLEPLVAALAAERHPRSARGVLRAA